MGRFYTIAILILLTVFVLQQSHVIEKKIVFDRILYTDKEEIHVNWNNLTTYLIGIVERVKGIPEYLKKKFQRKRRR